MGFYTNISHYCLITVGAVSAVLAATSYYCLIALMLSVLSLLWHLLADFWPVSVQVSLLHSILFLLVVHPSFYGDFLGVGGSFHWSRSGGFFPKRDQRGVCQLVSWQVICDRLLVIQSWLCISDVVVSSILLCASWLVWLSVLLLLSSLLVSAICDLFLRSVPHVRLRLSELHLIHSVMPLLSSDRLILRFVPQAPFCDAAAEQSSDA